MSKNQTTKYITYPSCTFRYLGHKLTSIQVGSELYVPKSNQDTVLEKMGKRVGELEDKLAHAKAAHPGDFVFTYTDSEYDEMQRTLREKDASINALEKQLDGCWELIHDQGGELDELTIM